jgi:hypothetical protein
MILSRWWAGPGYQCHQPRSSCTLLISFRSAKMWWWWSAIAQQTSLFGSPVARMLTRSSTPLPCRGRTLCLSSNAGVDRLVLSCPSPISQRMPSRFTQLRLFLGRPASSLRRRHAHWTASICQVSWSFLEPFT